MGDEYQLRKDVDKIYDDIYDYQSLKPNVYTKNELEEKLKEEYYDQSQVDSLIIGGDLTDYVKKSDTEGLVRNDGSIDETTYQELLESGTNIKTINNASILGEGNIHIEGSGGSILEPYLVPKSEDNRGLLCFDESSQLTFDDIYPVGAIYMSVNSTNPSNLFGGTWQQIAQGRTLIGQGTGTDSNNESKTFNNGDTGGEYNHTLTKDQMPSHTHTQDAHNHTQAGHSHGTGNSTYNKFMATNKNIQISNNKKNTVNGSDSYVVFTYDDGGEIAEYTATDSKTPTINNKTATNQNTGGGQAHNNIQPYFTCYIWMRTA